MFTILYSDSVQIRSAAGLDEHDISDTMLQGMNLELLLLERLEQVLPTHETDSSDEAIERKLILWCQYYGAWSLITDATLAIPQKIQANTDSVARFKIDFDKLAANLQGKIIDLEKKLNSTIAASGTIALVGSAKPGYDPVTGV